MSYPYPQDRHLDRKEKGDQPYEDAREAYSEKQAELRDGASQVDDVARLSREEQDELMERNAEERFRDIAEELEKS